MKFLLPGVAALLLTTDEAALDAATTKFKRIVGIAAIKEAAELGTASKLIYIIAASIRGLTEGDVQSNEGTNSLITCLANRAPRISLTLLDARCRIKKSIGAGHANRQEKWSVRRQAATRVLISAMDFMENGRQHMISSGGSRFAVPTPSAEVKAAVEQDLINVAPRGSPSASPEQTWATACEILLHKGCPTADVAKLVVITNTPDDGNCGSGSAGSADSVGEHRSRCQEGFLIVDKSRCHSWLAKCTVTPESHHLVVQVEIPLQIIRATDVFLTWYAAAHEAHALEKTCSDNSLLGDLTSHTASPRVVVYEAKWLHNGNVTQGVAARSTRKELFELKPFRQRVRGPRGPKQAAPGKQRQKRHDDSSSDGSQSDGSQEDEDEAGNQEEDAVADTDAIAAAEALFTGEAGEASSEIMEGLALGRVHVTCKDDEEGGGNLIDEDLQEYEDVLNAEAEFAVDAAAEELKEAEEDDTDAVVHAAGDDGKGGSEAVVAVSVSLFSESEFDRALRRWRDGFAASQEAWTDLSERPESEELSLASNLLLQSVPLPAVLLHSP